MAQGSNPQPPRPPVPGNPFASSPPPGLRNPFASEPAPAPQNPFAPPPASHPSGQPAPAGAIPVETLKNALKAFKKRLKLARLDDESRLGHGPMSGGGRSGITAITPPAKYPAEVWEELHRQGKLRRAGSGMYELPE